ncbi:MAG: hypothetical protein ACOYJQ_15825 [Pseudochelatococcus sp.]|uniref:hypothetical protein n=1 Tax=Pseudochelatococcus sp. TaxID=2020869 RepID=UPI003D90D081
MSVSLFGSRSILGALQQVEQTQRGQGSQDASHLLTLSDKLSKSATQLNDKARALNEFKAEVRTAAGGSAVDLLKTVLSHMKPDALRHVNVAYNLSASADGSAGERAGTLHLAVGEQHADISFSATSETQINNYLTAHELAMQATAHVEGAAPAQIDKLREAIFAALENTAAVSNPAAALRSDPGIRGALDNLGLKTSIIALAENENGVPVPTVLDMRTDPKGREAAIDDPQLRETLKAVIAYETAEVVVAQAKSMASTLTSKPSQAQLDALSNAVINAVNNADVSVSQNNELRAGTVSFDPNVRAALEALGLEGCIVSADTDRSGTEKLTLTDISSALNIVVETSISKKTNAATTSKASLTRSPMALITSLNTLERNRYLTGNFMEKHKYQSNATLTDLQNSSTQLSYSYSSGSQKINFSVNKSCPDFGHVVSLAQESYVFNLQKKLIAELQHQGLLNTGHDAEQQFRKITKFAITTATQGKNLPLSEDAIAELAVKIADVVTALRTDFQQGGTALQEHQAQKEEVEKLRSQSNTCFGGWRRPTREIDAGALAAALARAS